MAKGFVRLSEAAKIVGISRRQAYRVFKPYAQKMAHRGNFFLVPISAVHRELSGRLVEEIPLHPELQEFGERLAAMEDRIEKLCRQMGSLARAQAAQKSVTA
ncbi:MAG TPA: hypothetical protein VGK73_11275 [Polyangiaceae bacterium]